MNKYDILNDLICFKLPLQEIKVKMRDVPWDGDPLVILTEKKLREVINKYLKDTISEDDLIEWANIIECREDIEFEKNKEEKIRSIVFEIANPELMSGTSFKSFISGLYEYKKEEDGENSESL